MTLYEKIKILDTIIESLTFRLYFTLKFYFPTIIYYVTQFVHNIITIYL
jgi:hypothetical protein